ncbi:hypothetical protein DFO79_1097 [Pseudidiomarina tainanensis]|uniref:Uncharacterized protein n=2 Tax=Pseudidiomarina TaxID=2800384 RepID=A0A368UTM6_9GAMM|nr:hypothetical protein DET45_10866 [Pseudidiomarina maritima]RBP89826.1 hypothetical protein DFO81_1097 [Pseudidiomarina tainanensis]RCW31390.1 hypothetical protein DFO79_1097 [Pseudidiomarina tainanensis]
MCMSQRKVTRLHVVYRAAETTVPAENRSLTATHKNFLAVQVVSRLNGIQGKGISDDQ